MAASATLHLLERPQLRGHRIQYSDALHLLVIDETVIPCTPTEYSTPERACPSTACSPDRPYLR